jgi:4'-phosphopantetheinyl transferase EntD
MTVTTHQPYKLNSSSDLEMIDAWMAAHAPKGTAWAVGTIESGEPFDATEAAVIESAMPVRRNEFVTGRRLARLALAQLGCATTALPCDVNRVPIWPAGFTGTISHTSTVCVAHVGHTANFFGMGIDIEPDVPLADELVSLICRPDEDSCVYFYPPLLRFIAKEAFYKAYFPLARCFLDFQDVHVELDFARNIFLATLLGSDKPIILGRRSFEGFFGYPDGHLIAALWLKR